MKEDIKRSLIDFIVNEFMVDESEIILDESLIDQGIIDSFGLVEISTFMENEFSIKITEEEMTRDNFGSVLKMVAFIERLKNE